MRTCEYCGAELMRKDGEPPREWSRRRFCGRSCSVLARNPKIQAAKAERDKARVKQCARCGGEYLPALRHDRPSPYCSRLCSNRARADRQRGTWAAEDRGYVTPCWTWRGTIGTGGYGKVSVGNRSVPAHRWVYEQRVGQIPAGLHLDHLCEQRDCVNPDHLDPCTGSENTRRSWERGRHNDKLKRAA